MGPPPDLFAELSRWRSKAERRGKATEFDSDIIPDWLNAEMMAAQEAVGIEAFAFLKQASLEERMAAERRIHRRVRAILKGRIDEATEAIQAGREFDYEGLAGELRAAVLPELSKLVVTSALDLSVEVGIGFDPAVVNELAVNWAREYSFELVSQLTETTRRALSRATESFISTPGMTVGDLRDLIEPAFGPVRAEMIAVTETTRAYSAATNELQDLISTQGVSATRVWLTANDDLVCPICGPLHEQPESVWRGDFPHGPPAHVNCRCDLALEF